MSLAVDDAPSVRKALRRVLRAAGHGGEALALGLLLRGARGRSLAGWTPPRAAWAARVGVVLGLVALLMSLEVALNTVAP